MKDNCLEVVGTIRLPERVSAMVVRFRSRTATQVVVGCSDGIIRTYNTSSPFEHVGSLDPKVVAEDADPCTNFRHLGDTKNSSSEYAGQIIATYGSGMIRRWHVQTKSCLSVATPKNSGSWLAIDVRSDGQEYIVGGVATILELYDTTSSTPKKTFGLGVVSRRILSMSQSKDKGSIGGHSNRIHSVRYHPTRSSIVVSAGWDGNVCFWDLLKDYPLKQMFGAFICGDALDFCDNNENLLLGSYRDKQQLQVWDTNAEKVLNTISSDSDPSWIYSCMFSPKNPDIIATAGCKVNELRLVERSTGTVIGRVGDTAGFFSCHFSSDGSLLAGGGAGKVVTICKVTIPNGMIPICSKLTKKSSAAMNDESSWVEAPIPLLPNIPPPKAETFDLEPSDGESGNESD
eukprot:m.42074 g.42074  ORF g.42074 m.42074 type:complete len:402 (-) comp18996_c0_seq1:32-1237(-)